MSDLEYFKANCISNKDLHDGKFTVYELTNGLALYNNSSNSEYRWKYLWLGKSK